MQFVTRRMFSKAVAANSFKRSHMMFTHNIRFFASRVVKCPTMGDSISEGTVQEFAVKEGDFVKRDDVVALVETDKVTVDIRAPADGVVKKFYVGEGEVIEVEADFFELDTDATGGSSSGAKESGKTEAKATPDSGDKAKPKEDKSAAPKEEKKESGSTEKKETRVPEKEQKQSPPSSINTGAGAKKPAAPPKGTPAPPGMQVGKEGLSTITGSRTETRVKMSRMRQTISKRLKDAQNTNAMLTTFNEVDMSAFMDLRKQFQDPFQKKHGVKLGFMGAFVKGVVQAVKEQPVVNAVIEGDEIVYRDYVDISVAVATPTGLVVPVLRNCENMRYADVEQSLAELSIKARDGKIGLDDMKGGTFTITNGGVFGSMMGTPIINPPQSAILGMHAIKNRPVCVGNSIVARPIMYLALTYDHRLIDGREAVLFLRKIKECVEDPNNVLFDL
jgi:2-oxoglutarate dehydrogenase E2 component (dihydrolipoamide succinyltransferase)